MCLLLFAWQTDPDHPLVVAANRDERLDRPSEPIGVLRDRQPRTIGGRDLLAGGTWLAINEHGVVAGLTNRPSPGGRDPAKRSRGELPLLATDGRTAEAGVAKLVRRVRPGDHNPAWLLVGDRRRLFYVELPLDGAPRVEPLQPGIHILENAALDAPSWKVDRVRSLLEGPSGGDGDVWSQLPAVLADHDVPVEQDLAAPLGGEVVERRLATHAACVHTEDYGTRSATLVRLHGSGEALPEVRSADGPPCTAGFVDASALWRG